MSTEKGNTQRKRPQKYQNSFAFKNSLHDTSHRTKAINSLQIANVCEKCKKIIEWKIKYKKYKPLKAPGKCNKCNEKTVKHAYHTMCGPCARQRNLCPKCGQSKEIVEVQPTKEEQLKLDAEMQTMLKALPERKRRTFLRFVNQHKEKRKGKRGDDGKEDGRSEKSEENKEDEDSVECTREDLIDKLKSLAVEKDEDEDDIDDLNSDFSDDDLDSIES